MTEHLEPLDLLIRLQHAQNEHDIDTFVACFAAEYRSDQPAHPDRTFVGREQVRANCSSVFATVPDFRAELIRAAADGTTVWTEWRWTGTKSDGSRLHDRGVIIFGVERGEIAWARLYLAPVEEHGGGIEEAVERVTGSPRR
jgi:limonene-1,2-epoxide hydrolase